MSDEHAITHLGRADAALGLAPQFAAAHDGAAQRAFFQQSSCYAWLLSPEGTLIEANALALDTAGLAAADTLGCSFWNCGWWNRACSPAHTVHAGVQAAARGLVFRREAECFAAEGGRRTLDLVIAPVRDAGGEIVFLAATATDVTERVLAQQKLRESEQRFAGIFAQTSGGIAQTDAAGRFVLVNDRYCEITGRTREELLRLRMQDITHPEDLRTNEAQFRALVEGRGDSFVVEKRYLRPDGTEVWVHNEVSALRDAQGRMLYATAIVTDVSALRQAEEQRRRADRHLRDRDTQLRLAMEASLASAFEWDVVHDRVQRLQSFEPAFPQTLRTADTLEDVARAVLPEDRELFFTNVRGALERRDGVYRSEFRIVRPNGEIRWLGESGRVEFDAHGRPKRLIGISHDITDRKRAEATVEIRARQQQALARLGMTALHERDLQQVFDRACETVCRTLDVEMCKVLELLPGGEHLLLRAGIGWREGLVGREILNAHHGSQAGYTLATDEPVIVEDLRTETRFYGPGLLHRHSVVSGMSCLVAGSHARTWGVLGAHTRAFRRFTADDVAFLQGVANVLAASVQREDAERALRESEERLRLLGDNLPDSVVYQYAKGIDGRARFLHLSAGLERVNGVAVEDVLRDAEVLRGQIEPEHRERLAAAEQRSAAELSDLETEVPMRLPDGTLRWMRLKARPRRESDGSVVWDGVQTDVTERRRAAENLVFLADVSAAFAPLASPQAIARIAAEQIGQHFGAQWVSFSSVSPTADRVTLLAGRGGLEGERPSYRLADYMSEPLIADLAAGHAAAIDDIAADPRTAPYAPAYAAWDVGALALAPYVSDGQWSFLLAVCRREPRAWRQDQIALLQEVTARVHLRIERARAEEALREADRRKDEFLATLAHELRNPLAPVRNAVQILHLKGPPLPELEWARGVIDRQMAQMARLIDDLLDVSRITRGKLELRKERVELARVVREAVDTSRPLIEECGHALALSLPEETITLEADFVRLAQIFANLLNNAAKYTERGGRIALGARREGAHVLVAVEDNGIGIPADRLGTIFEMFSQVETALRRSRGGLGIGLSLVKRLVEMHGGTITAESGGPGRGSIFTVRLPVTESAAQEAAPAPPPPAEAPRGGGGLHILVVDDNRDAAASLALLLEATGHRVRTAHDGEEAVSAAAAARPDVVLLDIGLPKLTGYEACRRIRQQPGGEDVLVIAVTGWGQEADRRRTQAAGFDRHLVKPVDPHALLALLAQWRPGDPQRMTG